MSSEIVEHRENFTMSDIEIMAEALSESKVNGYTKPQITTLLLISQAEGLHPMLALKRYDLIKDKNGGIKIEKKAYAMLGEFKDKGGKVEWIERSDKIAKAKFVEPDGTESVFEFTEKDAITAGLLNKQGKADNWSNWTKRRDVMLVTKLLKKALRILDPESGLQMSEYGISPDVSEPREPINEPPPRINITPETSKPGEYTDNDGDRWGVTKETIKGETQYTHTRIEPVEVVEPLTLEPSTKPITDENIQKIKAIDELGTAQEKLMITEYLDTESCDSYYILSPLQAYTLVQEIKEAREKAQNTFTSDESDVIEIDELTAMYIKNIRTYVIKPRDEVGSLLVSQVQKVYKARSLNQVPKYEIALLYKKLSAIPNLLPKVKA